MLSRTQVVRLFGGLPRAPECICDIVIAYLDLGPICLHIGLRPFLFLRDAA